MLFYVFMYVETWGDNYIILYGASLITGCSLVGHWISEQQIDLKFVPYGIWNNLVMVAYSVITGFFAAYMYSELIDSCITYAAFSVICIAVCYVSAEEGSMEWLYKVLIAIALACAIYMLTRGTEWGGYGRTLSSHNNPHVFAAVMNLGIFSAAYRCKKHDTKEAIVSGAMILLFFFCIIESGSRKYLIASAFIVGIWGITQSTSIWRKNDTNQRILLVITLIPIIGLGAYYIQNMFSSSLIYSRLQDNNDAGNVNRIVLYQKAIEIFKNNPLFGGGYDQFKFWSGTRGYAHSTYAEAIADYGFVGSVLYFIPLFYAAIRIIRNAINSNREYHSVLLLAFCLSELFLGVGQIFYMEFCHFIAWSIIFFLSAQIGLKEKKAPDQLKQKYRYIRP